MKTNDSFIDIFGDDIIYVKADTILENQKSVDVYLHLVDYNDAILYSEKKSTSVQDGKIQQEYSLERIFNDNNINELSIARLEGEIQWNIK